MSPDTGRPPVGVVLAGAGARGAYEAGAVAEALRVLPRDRPRVLVGTSAGAINALLLASLAHLPPDQAADQLVGRWQRADRDTVIGPVIASGALAAARYLAAVASAGAPAVLRGRRAQVSSLLDNAPLRRTANDCSWLDWDLLHRNVQDGLVSAVAVVATRVPDGRSVVFVERAPGVPLPAGSDARGIDYVDTRLGPEHLMASSAIPVAFPAEAVGDPSGEKLWYVDGGTRLNTPIKPALDLGAEQVLVVATDPAVRPSRPEHVDRRPDVTDALAALVHTVLADRMIEDLAHLVARNRMLAAVRRRQLHVTGTGGQGRTVRVVPYQFVGPREEGLMASTARRVYRERYGGLRGWVGHPDFPALSAIIDGSGVGHDDLLSYLFFDNAFLVELVRLGTAEANRRLSGHDWLETELPV